MLGVLGGMGPLATADFLSKLVTQTRATRDQDNLPAVIWSVPQVPDRTEAIFGRSQSPLPHLLRGIACLTDAGATMIAMPCNTAHHWYSQLAAASCAPILHIAEAAVGEIEAAHPQARAVGILATEGTLGARIYHRHLEPRYRVVSLPEAHREVVSRGISCVKSGRVLEARPLFQEALERLRAGGADVVLLACTEIPLAAPKEADVIDTSEALAKECVRRFRGGFAAAG